MTRWSSAAVGLAVLLSPCSAEPRVKREFVRPCMGTLFGIVIHSERSEAAAEAAADDAFALAAELDACLSDYRADSEVGRFHRSPAGEPQPISATLADILSRSEELCETTRGAFDPARGALTRLWRMARRTGKLPSAEDLLAGREASGLRQLEFDSEKRTLTRRCQLARLDFGGIAKGYAADAMLTLLRERGFPCASVAAGGDVRCGDPPPGQAGWKVEVRLAGDSSPAALILVVANGAVSTSGRFEQNLTISGAHYSHIIDPATGLGLTSNRAATVIAPTATESDALATALCVLGESGIPLIASRKGCEGAVFASASARAPAFQTEDFAK